MAANNKTSGPAVEYARALLELANERQQAESIAQELEQLSDILDSNPAFRDFLRDPGIGEDERKQVIEKVFRGNISPLVMNLMGVLNSKGRLGLLPRVIEAYHDLLDQQLGKVEVDAFVAHRLSPALLEEVRRQVSKALGKEAVVHQYVDESIVGGMVLRVGDQLMDGSVRSQLEALRRQLAVAPPGSSL